MAAKVAAKQEGFLKFGTASLERVQITGIPGTSGAAGSLKMAENRKANCFALLKRITNSKV